MSNTTRTITTHPNMNSITTNDSSTSTLPYPPVPHPILIPLVPSLALLASLLLIIYLNRGSLNQLLPCWKSHPDGYECVGGDGKRGIDAYESSKKQKQSSKGEVGRRRERNERREGPGPSRTTALGLWRGSEISTGKEEEEIELRPLIRDGRTPTIHNIADDEDENEFFFIPSDSSIPVSPSSPTHSVSNDDDEQEQPHSSTRHEPRHEDETDPLSLSKYFHPQTHDLLPEYRDPPSPRTEEWEVELRRRIRQGGSIEAWVDRVVDCAAEWWEGVCT